MRRPGDHPDAAAKHGERRDRRHLVLIDEPRHERLHRRPLQSADGGHPRRRRRTAARPTCRLAASSASAALPAASATSVTRAMRRRSTASASSAADERRRQQRHQLGQAEQADRQRRARQPVHLVRQRDVGDHRAEQRHGLRGVQQAIVPMAERREVHGCGSEIVGRSIHRVGGGKARAGTTDELYLICTSIQQFERFVESMTQYL